MGGCGTHLDVFNFSTNAWYLVHYTTQIILQPCFVLINISCFIPILSKISFHVDPLAHSWKMVFCERYFNTLIVINDKGVSIPLDWYDLSSAKLPHDPPLIVWSHS